MSGKSKWLVTGCAGFIGSHILERLLISGQKVIGIDNLCTGTRPNLDEVQRSVGSQRFARDFKFFEASINASILCMDLIKGIDFVVHQAGISSVPLSFAEPEMTHNVNVNGFLNILEASRIHQVKRVVYASSSSVYGDVGKQKAQESMQASPLSPYAKSKLINEQYADLYWRMYGLPTIGLRYFNVYGPRQSATGSYAAVIPRWFYDMKANSQVYVFGDGTQVRDFCFVGDIVDCILHAAQSARESNHGQVYNVGRGEAIQLLDLWKTMKRIVEKDGQAVINQPQFRPAQQGQINFSQADTGKLKSQLGVELTTTLEPGLLATYRHLSEHTWKFASKFPA